MCVLCTLQGAPDWTKLRTLAGRDGDLRLSHFRRVKQLGSGDVGLVDLVQIQVGLITTYVMTSQTQNASGALGILLSTAKVSGIYVGSWLGRLASN